MSEEITPPSTVIFRPLLKKQLFYLALGAITMLQGVFTGWYFLFAPDEPPRLAFLTALISGLIIWTGLWFLRQAWRRLSDPPDAITIGPEGLHDRALSERPMPWKDIRDVRVFRGARGGAVIGFDLVEGAEERCGVRKGVSLSARINQRVGYSYRIHQMGTEADPGSLVEALARHTEVRLAR